MKRRRKQKTGADPDQKPFLGLGYESQGFMIRSFPRASHDYTQMLVSEISNRIQDDIEELVARAYPTSLEEWAKKFAPVWWRSHSGGFSRCRYITEKLANRLRRGLWEEINSKERETAKKAQEECAQLLTKYYAAEPKYAASALAFMVNKAASYLEALSVDRAELMREVAKGFQLWPVNMGLHAKVTNNDGKRKIAMALTRRDFAERYLKELGVNTESQWLESAYTGRGKRSPFHIAATRLHNDLLMMKREPRRYFLKQGKRGWAPNITSWAKTLIALPEPMTKANAGYWWKVAKVWVDEQWEANREDSFGALIKYLKLNDKRFTPSIVKRRVVDDSLKKAYVTLAVPANL